MKKTQEKNSTNFSEETQSLILSPQQDLSGKQLREYAIEKPIGKGGMGVVYKAFDTRLKRDVAIKVITPEQHNIRNAQKASRFYREIQLSAQLEHPNIAKMYNHGNEQGTMFLVMQYIHGITLDKYLQENKLSQRQKIRIVLQIARAIKYAHSKKIVHRDIKPRNILVTPNRDIFVTDFGIAKALNLENKYTQTGEIIGTLRYMSPEQLAAPDKVDERTDIYSLGAVLYELLTGKKMLPDQEIVKNLLRFSPINMRQIDSSIPKSLETIWRKSVAPKHKRYKNIQDFIHDLEKFLQKKTIYSQQNTVAKMMISIVVFVAVFASTWHFSPFSKASQQKFSSVQLKSQNYFNYAMALKKQGAYEEAIEQLCLIITQDQKLQQDIIAEITIIHSQNKSFYEAIQYFEQYQGQSHSVLLAAIRAFFYQKNFTLVEAITKKILQSQELSGEQRATIFFYKGATLYEQNQYESALEALKTSEDLSQTLVFESRANLLLYLGKCYTQLKQFTVARSYLENAQKFIATAELYKHLGQTFFEDPKLSSLEQAEQALGYFRRAIELDSYNCDYLVLTGQCLLALKKSQEALPLFQKALFIDPNSPSAIKGIIYVLQEQAIGEEITRNILTEFFFSLSQIQPTELFAPIFQNIKRRYYENYYLQNSVSTEQNIDVFIETIQNTDNMHIYESASQALTQQRYHPQIIEKIQLAVQKNPENKRLREILDKITRQRQRDEKFALYYQMAHVYLQKDLNMLDVLQQKKSLLQNILTHSEVSPEIRYLAAKTLGKLFEYEILEEFCHHSVAETAAVCICVLQESGFIKHRDDLLFRVYENSNDIFLRALLVKNLKSSEFLKKALEDPNELVQISAASEGISSLDKRTEQQSQKKLLTFMEHHNKEIQLFAHFHFWKKATYNDQERRLFVKHLKTFDERLLKILLLNALKIDTLPHIDDFIQIIQKHSLATGLMAVVAVVSQYPFHPKLEQIFYSENYEAMIRNYIWTGSIANLLWGKKTNDRLALQKFLEMRNWLEKLDYKKNTDPLLKMFCYRTCCKLVSHPFDYIEKETDESIRAAMISYSIFWSRYNRIDRPLIPVNYYSNTSQKKYISKFLDSTHAITQRNAYAAYVFFCNSEERQELYKEFSTIQNPNIRSGIAIGFYELVRDTVYARSELAEQPNSFAVLVERILFELKAFSQLAKQQDFRLQFSQWLDKAIEFDARGFEYHYLKGLLHYQNQQYEEAEICLSKALETLNKTSFINKVYYTKLHMDFVFLLWEKGKKQQVQEILQNIQMENLHFRTLWYMRDKLLDLCEFPEIQRIFKRICDKDLQGTYHRLTVNYSSIFYLEKQPYITLARMYMRLQQKSKALMYLRYYSEYQVLKKEDLNFPEFTDLLQEKWIKNLKKN